MREKLFRGKLKDSGEWVYGFYAPFASNKGLKHSIYTGAEIGCVIPLAVIPETVGQYTVLTDKNGKKTFEGDICRVVYIDRRCDTDGKYHENEHEMIEEVVLEKGAFCFKVTIDNISFYRPIGFDIHWKQKVKYFEVIGNIYDNPELLEVQA